MVNSGASMPGPRQASQGSSCQSGAAGYFEYNFNRPRQSFDYLAPRVYIDKEVTKIRSPVLPVWTLAERNRAKLKT